MALTGKSIVPAFIAVAFAASGCSHTTARQAHHDAAAEAGVLDCAVQYGVLAAGQIAQSEQGLFSIEVTSLMPTAPTLGDNSWDFVLTDAHGDPLPGVNVRFSLWMPEHAHGSLKTVIVDDLGQGHYHAEPLNFHMPGRWDVTVSVETSAGSDRAIFTTCVTP